MAFLQRFTSGLKEGLSSLTSVADVPSRKSEERQRGLAKQSSRGKRPTTASLGYLEEHTREAIASFVQDKFDKGECKPHVFTQFWLQFPKLQKGFEVLRVQLEQRTGSREGPLPLVLLQSSPQDFGLSASSQVVQELCDKALSHKCTDIDFVGLVMLLLVVHLTEPASAAEQLPLHPDVRTMLSCLELAFTHFNSARKGKLDKREVGEALQYESAKAHTREGRSGRTSNRLAHRLFEGLDWEYDNTISFENFLRGILQLVQDEYGEEDDGELDLEGEGGRSGASDPASPTSRPTTTSMPLSSSRRSGSTRCDKTEPGQAPGSNGPADRPRSASATGLTVGESPTAVAASGASGGGGGGENGLLALIRGSLRRARDDKAGAQEGTAAAAGEGAATAAAP